MSKIVRVAREHSMTASRERGDNDGFRIRVGCDCRRRVSGAVFRSFVAEELKISGSEKSERAARPVETTVD